MDAFLGGRSWLAVGLVLFVVGASSWWDRSLAAKVDARLLGSWQFATEDEHDYHGLLVKLDKAGHGTLRNPQFQNHSAALYWSVDSGIFTIHRVGFGYAPVDQLMSRTRRWLTGVSNWPVSQSFKLVSVGSDRITLELFPTAKGPRDATLVRPE